MKHLSLKKVLAIVLSLAIVMAFLPMTVSANSGTDVSVITVSGDTVTLTLEYANTYYDRQTTGYDDASDIRGATLNLINTALDTYNTENGTSLAIADIDNLKVKTAADVRLTYRFSEILKAKLPQLVEIDMSESAVTQKCYSWDNAIDNWFREDYFAGMNSLKKVSLPAGAVILRYQALANLPALEEVVMGNAVEEFGYSLFYGSSKLTKLDIPASLCKLSSVGQFFDASGIKEFSFHGTAENATDKAAFFNTLTTAMNRVNFTKLDLSNSGIGETNALTLARKASLEYIDLSGCTNIDLTTTDGQSLYSRLVELHTAGKTVIMPPLPEGFSNEFAGLRNCKSEIKVGGDTTELVLDLGYSYYDATWGTNMNAGFTTSDTYDIRYNFTLLMEGALGIYNFNKGTSLTVEDIDKLTITTQDGIYLSPAYAAFVQVKLPHLVELDLSGAAFNGGLRSYEEANANIIPGPGTVSYSYSLSGSGTTSIMTSLKKLSLPKGVTSIGSSTFRNLRALEYLVLPDSVSIGYDSFTYCDNLKTIVAKDVTEVRDWWNNRSACIENIIFTGTQLNFLHNDGTTQTLPGYPTLYCTDATAYAGVNDLNKVRFNKVVYVGDMSTVKADVVDGKVVLSKDGSLYKGETLVEDKFYSVEWNAADLLKKWYQYKSAQDGTYTLRFVSTIDSLEYTNVGFAVSLSNENPTVGGTNCISDTSSKVYGTLFSGSAQVTPAEHGAHESANYFYAYQLSGVPADFDGEIYIRPFYTTTDGVVVYGSASAVTVADVIA